VAGEIAMIFQDPRRSQPQSTVYPPSASHARRGRPSQAQCGEKPVLSSALYEAARRPQCIDRTLASGDAARRLDTTPYTAPESVRHRTKRVQDSALSGQRQILDHAPAERHTRSHVHHPRRRQTTGMRRTSAATGAMAPSHESAMISVSSPRTPTRSASCMPVDREDAPSDPSSRRRTYI